MKGAENMRHYLGIDIGGSKTVISVTDEKLSELKRVTATGFGISTESEEDIPELRKIINELKNEFNICSAAVNLGGKNKKQIHNILKNCLPDSIISVFRESESNASVSLAKKTDAQCVLLAGTGTIVTAFDGDGRTLTAGGWGMNIGDGGSGYYIGLEAVKRSLKALDKVEMLTPLAKEITGLTDPIMPSDNAEEICNIRDGVRWRIFPIERKKIAAYTKTVAKHCENGEEDALEIMACAGHEMAELCSECVNKLLPYKVRKIVVCGGLVNCNAYWKDAFEKNIKMRSSVTDFEYIDDGILLGTKLIAVSQYGKDE